MSVGTVTTTQAKLQSAYATLGAYRNALLAPDAVPALIEKTQQYVDQLEREFAAEEANDIEAWK